MRTRRSPRNQDRLWRELGQQGATPAAPPYVYAETLYDELYIPCTEETRLLLIHYGHDRRGVRATAEVFINQVEGGRWYDVPFGYAPFWREVARKAEAAEARKGAK